MKIEPLILEACSPGRWEIDECDIEVRTNARQPRDALKKSTGESEFVLPTRMYVEFVRERKHKVVVNRCDRGSEHTLKARVVWIIGRYFAGFCAFS